MSYRILLHNLLTGVLISEVRPTAAKWSRALNGAGSAQVTAPSAVLLAALQPLQSRLGSAAITIVNPSGTVEFSGPLWAADVTLDGEATLTASGPLSLLQRRVVRTDLTYTAVDQATIAAALVNHAQDTSGSRPDRDLRISTASVTTHGRLRDRLYPAGEAKPIGEALVELANVTNGFTFAITGVLGVNRSLSYRLDLTHPNTGQATTAVLLHRANCLVAKVAMDATSMASEVVAIGGNNLLTRRGGALAGWPCLEVVRTWNDVTILSTLQAHGDRAVALGKAPTQTPALQVLDVQAPVPLDALPRLVVPEVGIDANYRVLQVDTTLQGDVALSALTLAPAALFT